MRSTFIVYVLVGLLSITSLYLANRWFFSASTEEKAEAPRGTETGRADSLSASKDPKDSRASRRTQSMGMMDSVWTEDSFAGNRTKDRFGRDLAQFAEIRSTTNRLQSALDARQFQDVERELKQLIAENPNVPDYQAMLGDVYLHLQWYHRAEEPIRELVRLDPENEYARVILADVLGVNGDPAEAQTQIEQVLERNPRNELALRALLSNASLQGVEELRHAEQRLGDYWRQDSGNLAAGSQLVAHLVRKGDVEEASSIAREIQNIAPGSLESHRVLSLISAYQEDRQGWLEHSRQWSSKEESFESRKNLFQALAANNLFDEALRIGQELQERDEEVAQAMRILQFRQSSQP